MSTQRCSGWLDGRLVGWKAEERKKERKEDELACCQLFCELANCQSMKVEISFFCLCLLVQCVKVVAEEEQHEDQQLEDEDPHKVHCNINLQA